MDFNYGESYLISLRFKVSGTGNNMHIFSHGGDNDSASINLILDDNSKTLTTRYNGQAVAVFGSNVYNEVTDGYRHYYNFAVDNGHFVPGQKTVMVRIDGIDYYTDSTFSLGFTDPTNNIVIGRSSASGV